MADTVQVKIYDEPALDTAEILRYAAMRSTTSETAALLEECLDEVRGRLTYKVCFRSLPLTMRGDTLDLGFAETDSADLRRTLRGCCRIVLFAATVGLAPDQLIARYGRTAPSKAFLFQAIGTERIESLCNAFSADIEKQASANGLHTCPRFSPGYGDLPLSLQNDIFQALDCPRKIGLSLNGSLLMTPAKSVTAIIGIGRERDLPSHSCASCGKQDCVYRRNI